jgi:beta-N-acetylhexosaminidase
MLRRQRGAVRSGGGRAPRAAIVGISGHVLTDAEIELFRMAPPAGVILFARNCRDRDQLRALVAALRALSPERHLPVLIDQEGGRVARMKPPEWSPRPAAAAAGMLAERDPAAGREAAWLVGRLIAHDLAEVGIDIDCAPVIDVRRPETTDAIGDRAFGADPHRVAELAQAFIEGLIAGGVAPVVKHLPGHGRARVDSHATLPVVDASVDELMAADLVPARRLAHLPFGMTAHLLYRSIDPERPATLSPTVIGSVIRETIGFRGLLISDDLAMGALEGTPETRAAAALAAGCDLALACTGRIEESAAVLTAAGPLSADRLARLDQALPPPAADGFDPVAAEERLLDLHAPVVA